MDKELLMLYAVRHAVLKMLEGGNCSFAKSLDDGTWLTVEYTDICNYLTEKIDKYKAESEIENGNDD